MASRSQPDELDASAVVALETTLTGLGVRVSPGGVANELAVDVDGVTLTVEVHSASVVDGGRASTRSSGRTAATPILVADKITGPARHELNERRWSWLDRRGHLRLRGGGVLIDTDVDPLPREVGHRHPTDVLASRGGREIAAALLLDGTTSAEEMPGVRELARQLDLSPSTVSRALAELRRAGLVRKDNRPVVPDLFWTLAEHWRPRRYALATEPEPRDDVEDWVIGDTRAALAWGAPVVADANTPIALYVPDDPSLQAVLRDWRPGPKHDVHSPTVAVAPVRSLTNRRFRRPPEPWPVVHPLFAALDLATDRARGHEILETFEPQADDLEGFRRVW